tara:strand:- start:384 stop:794 length:411 start_codon:yes stop_codon:yes gene_type:complete
MTEVLDNVKPNIEELHDAVMEVLDQDYIDFEYSFTKEGEDFTHYEMDGNADEGDDLEVITLWDESNKFEVTIERGYKQRGTEGEGEDLEYIYDMNYQGMSIEGDYDAYVAFLKKEWPGVYEDALEMLQRLHGDVDQ